MRTEKRVRLIMLDIEITFDIKDCNGRQLDVEELVTRGDEDNEFTTNLWPMSEAWKVDPYNTVTEFADKNNYRS